MILHLQNSDKPTLIDEGDYFRFWLIKWRLSGFGYVQNRQQGTLHILIATLMGLTGKIDHADQDPLNNQRSNLRIATQSQNAANSKLRFDNSSGYRGVCWHTAANNWRAYIDQNGKRYHLGSFDDPIEAALAYDAEALRRFGEFAALNFPRAKQ